MTPSDLDLFATLTMLTELHSIDYGILHTCTLDSMGHRYGRDCSQMDHACFTIDAKLAALLPRWRKSRHEIIVTADHGQTNRVHYGGHDDEMQASRCIGSVVAKARGRSLSTNCSSLRVCSRAWA